MSNIIKPFPIGEAVNMLLEGVIPNFAWFFSKDKTEAVKFRKALTTELGRRLSEHPDKVFTTNLVSAVYDNAVAFIVVVQPKEIESESESEE